MASRVAGSKSITILMQDRNKYNIFFVLMKYATQVKDEAGRTWAMLILNLSKQQGKAQNEEEYILRVDRGYIE